MRWWTYWHLLEYVPVDERGRRGAPHTERVDDHGPYIGPGPEAFARLCAEDYLTRQQAPAGRWRVVLWRMDDTGVHKTRRLCEIELRWPGVPAGEATQQDDVVSGGAR
ncbi:MAG TPA: hypothetical protein VIL00_09465 [Pseudonocardiaceae bacterium]